MRYGFGHFEEDRLGPAKDRAIWRRIAAWTAPRRAAVAAAILLAAGVIAASLTLPYLVKLGVDRFVVNLDLPIVERLAGLRGLAGLFLFIVVAGFAANFLQVLVLEWTGQTIMHQMRQELFSHMLRLDLGFCSRNPTGKLVTRVSNDIQNMHEMFTSVIVTLFNDLLQLLGIMAILFWMNWRLALLLTMLVPLILINTVWFSRLARDAFRAIRTGLAQINSFLQEALSGISIIQIFLRENDTTKRFTSLNQIYFEKTRHQIMIFGIFMPAIELLSALAIAGIIWYGGGEIMKNHLTLGELVAFLSYMRLFFQPLRELSQKYSIVQSAMASAERIFEVLDRQSTLSEEPEAAKPSDLAGRIEFRHVSFRYGKDDPPVLKDICFTVAPGEAIAIVGATGAGKSTIINLIERFYDPDEGEIQIDGLPLRGINTTWLRQRIGLVLQDVFLVPGTVRDNILLGRTMDDQSLNRIVSEAQLATLMESLPEGLETLIGEGGTDISAGQRQLLSFARVLARDPAVLILDEATSSVDSETEFLIDRAIETALSGRTSIVIAHRLSTIRRAHRILVLEGGAIIEQGSHAELIARQGLFSHLQNLQNGENTAL
jgi:ATP-binding cassette subfamily B protein